MASRWEDRRKRPWLAGPLVTAVLTAAAALWLPTAAEAHTPHDVAVEVVLSPTFDRDATVYLISREHVLRSRDEGDTWTTLTRGLDLDGAPTTISPSAADPDVLYLSSRGDGVLRSADRGTTWRRASSGLEQHLGIAWVAASPLDPDEAFAAEGYGGGLYRTLDGGRSWTPTGLGAVTSLAFDAERRGAVMVGDSSGAVHVSSDGGGSWDAPVVVSRDRPVRTLAIGSGPGSSSVILAGTDGTGVWRSTDGARSFQKAVTAPADGRVRAIRVSPDFERDRQAWATTWSDGFCRSKDAGRRWACDGADLPTDPQADELELPQFQPIAVGPDRPGGRPVFVGAWAGLFRSPDGGDTWEELETQSPQNITSLDVVGQPAGGTTLVLSTYVNGVLISDDAGATWRPAYTGLATRHDWSRRPDYISRVIGVTASPAYARDGELFGSLRGFMVHSPDRGVSWSAAIPPGIANAADSPPDYFFIAVSPAYATDHVVVLGTNRGKVFRSTTTPPSYERVADLGEEVTALVASPDFGTDHTLIATTLTEVLRSTDGGLQWESAGTLDAAATSLTMSPDFAGDDTVFAGTADGLYLSTDRATSWSRVDAEAVPPDAHVEAVVPSPAFASDRVVIASIRGQGLVRSEDGGATFERVGTDLLDDQAQFASWYHPTTEPIVFSPDFARDRTVYGISGTTLRRSVDGGTSWKVVPFPRITHDTDPAAVAGDLLDFREFASEGHGDKHTSGSPGPRDLVTEPTDTSATRWAAVSLIAVALVAGVGAWVARRRRRRVDA